MKKMIHLLLLAALLHQSLVGGGAKSWFESTASNAGSAITGAAHQVSGAVNDAAHQVSGAVSDAAQQVGGTVSDAAGTVFNKAIKPVGQALESAANTVQQGVTDAAHTVGNGFEDGISWFKDRFSDTKATRAIDYGIRKAALETALATATGVLDASKATAQGSLIAARETANATLVVAEQFLDKIVQNASTAVLQGPAQASKVILEGVKQGTIVALEGGRYAVTTIIEGGYDIYNIHYTQNYKELAKGYLGDVEIDGSILQQPVSVKFNLNPKQAAEAIFDDIKKAANTFVAFLKRDILDPISSAARTVIDGTKPAQDAAQAIVNTPAPVEITTNLVKTAIATQQAQQDMATLQDTMNSSAAKIKQDLADANNKAQQALQEQAKNPKNLKSSGTVKAGTSKKTTGDTKKK